MDFYLLLSLTLSSLLLMTLTAPLLGLQREKVVEKKKVAIRSHEAARVAGVGERGMCPKCKGRKEMYLRYARSMMTLALLFHALPILEGYSFRTSRFLGRYAWGVRLFETAGCKNKICKP